MLTPEGRAWIWRRVAGATDDPLTTVRASNATESATVTVSALEIVSQADTTVLRARASFGERDGNFEWQRRELVTGSGVVVDAAERDFGRKVLGAIWDVEIDMTLEALEASDG